VDKIIDIKKQELNLKLSELNRIKDEINTLETEKKRYRESYEPFK